MSTHKFAYINLLAAFLAAMLWYLFPQLMAWPLLLGLIPWLWRLSHYGKWRWRTPFDLPLLLFLLSGLLSVWSAFDREAAWSKYWTLVAGVLLFYALAAFSLPGAPDKRERGGIVTAWLMAFFGAAVSTYFIATHQWDAFPAKYAYLTSLGLALQGLLPTLPGHRLHPNVVGGILAMMIPFSAAVCVQAGKARNGASLILGIVLLGGTILGLVLSQSRGAWAALFAALALAVLWWLLGFVSQGSRRRTIFALVFVAGLLVVVGMSLLWPSVPQLLLEQMPLLAGGQNRLQLFRDSLILVQEYPLVGAGLGSYMMLHATYSLLTHVGYIIHAHNIYLDVLVEQGAFGLLPLVWAWTVFAIALWREMGRGKIRPYFGAAALSLVTILIHGLVEDALFGSRAAMLLFLPLAFALPYPKPSRRDEQERTWWYLAIAAGAVVVALVVWARPLASSAISNLAAIQQSRTELSRYRWPEFPIQDAVRRESDLSQVIDGYGRALSIDPYNAAARRRLGQIEISLGAYEAAAENLEIAFQSTPWDGASRQLYGEALLLNGRIEEGAKLWATLENAQSQLQARAFWYEYVGEDEALERIRAGLPGDLAENSPLPD